MTKTTTTTKMTHQTLMTIGLVTAVLGSSPAPAAPRPNDGTTMGPGGAGAAPDLGPGPASDMAGFSGLRVGLELGGGFARAIEDRYTDRLLDFGFYDQILLDSRWHLALAYALRPNIDLVLELGELDAGRYRRDNDPPHEFRWSTLGAALSLRYTHHVNRWLRPFAQAGAGVARAHSVYEMTGSPATDEDTFWGYRLSASAGVQVVPWRRLGFYARLGYDHAPVLENLIGDVHDSGGLHSSLGVLTRF